MITLELLQSFCAGDIRPAIMKPWTLPDGFTYATDGRIAIKVPALLAVPANPAAPQRMYDKGFLYEQEFGPLPVLPEPLVKRCETCEGTGMYECGACTCEDCEGAGDILEYISIQVGTRLLSDVYLRKIALLPNPIIGLTGDARSAVRFKFDGGEGVLMPRTK